MVGSHGDLSELVLYCGKSCVGELDSLSQEINAGALNQRLQPTYPAVQ